MQKRKKGFTLIELLVVVAIIALLISILLPSLSRARELSKRLVCGTNVRGFGTAFKIYANDNDEDWPVAPYSTSAASIKWYYMVDNNTPPATMLSSGGTTPARGESSCKDGATAPAPCSGGNGTTALTVTRSLWMLVRGGDVTAKSFICPSSGDKEDESQNVDLWFDFATLNNISYGYQVPYGPFDSRPSENIDPRLAVAADKGPYSKDATAGVPSTNSAWSSTEPNFFQNIQVYKTYNSGNHGGKGTGEGQNVLYGDGHASFEKTPVVGIDNDNIFTKISNESDFAKARGGGTATFSATAWYPGQNVFASGIGDSTTDSLIFP